MNHMDSELYTALVKGDIDVLKGKDWLQVRHQLTPAHNTVLHVACQYGRMKCVKEILQHADESLLLQTNSRGETALHLAARRGHYHAVEAVINKAKSWVPQPNNLDNRSSTTTVLQNLIRSPNVDSETALHAALRNLFIEKRVVEVLVKEDPSYAYPPNKFDETPLYLAAVGVLGSNHVMKIILDNCESPTFGGPHGRTALHAALMTSNNHKDAQERTKLLLSKNKDLIRVADVNGWTAFHYVAHNNLITVLDFLLSVDKSVAYLADTKFKRTPVHVAAYKGHSHVLKELLKYIPDAWENVDGNGQNIFHIAVKQEQKSVITYILSKDLGINLSIQKDNEGNTPLHLIAKFRCYFPELQRWIWKFEWNIMDDTNSTPLEVFYRKNNSTPIHEDLVGVTLDKVHVFGHFIRWVLDEGPKQGVRVETPKEKIRRYREMANSHMIVAALITTVALTAGFAMPGGFDGNQGPNQGSPLLLRKKAFKIFMVADTVALAFSISSLFLYFLTSFKLKTRVIYNFLIAAIVFNVVSMAAMMVAFIAGTSAVLSQTEALASTVFQISYWFLVLVFYVFLIPFLKMLKRTMILLHHRYLLGEVDSPDYHEYRELLHV